MHRRGEERRGEDQPERSEDAAARDRRDEDDERVQVEGRAHREGLEDVLQQPVGQQDDQEHHEGDGRPFRAEGDDHRERAGDERADERNVGGHEADHGDRAGQRDAEQQGADSDHDPVEGRDDRHAAEVAPQ